MRVGRSASYDIFYRNLYVVGRNFVLSGHYSIQSLRCLLKLYKFHCTCLTPFALTIDVERYEIASWITVAAVCKSH